MTRAIHGSRGYVMLRTITLIAALLVLSVPSPLKGGDDVLFKAMRDELDRSGATVESVMQLLGLKHAAVREFERVTGMPWPL